jgi:hypothetical protein
MRLIIIWAAAALAAANTSAQATPGVGDPVYGATISKGLTEFEARYGRLTGGVADGEDGLTLEVGHGFSSRFAGALLVEVARDAGGNRMVESSSLEVIYALGRIRPLALDFAFYGEYKYGFRANADVIETKLLLQHRAGGFDARMNLIAEKPLAPNEPVEFGYAASVDWQVVGDEVKLGLTAFGDLGTTRKFGARQEHFIGPTAKFEIERLGPGELGIEAGWLRAFGSARDVTDGQARLLIEYELRF